MARMNVQQLKAISDFTIIRAGVGSIQWPAYTDVTDIDLDSLVTIDQDDKGRPFVQVYEDDSKKPELGES